MSLEFNYTVVLGVYNEEERIEFTLRNFFGKAEIIINPCKSAARIQLLIANETPEKKVPFVSAEKMRILSATTAKLQRECKSPSVLLWIHSENAIFFASETIEKQKL